MSSDGVASAGGPRRGRAALHAVVLLGLGLRIAAHYGRSFEGDELGTLVHLERDYGYLLTHFESNLTMNWYIVLLKGVASLFGRGPWVLAAPSLAGGLATIYLVHALARRVLDERSALPAALLVACCPTLVESSIELRSYALFNALVLASFLAALAWLDSRRPSTGSACALWTACALLMHPNALFPLCFVATWVLIDLRADRRRWLSLVGPMALAALVVLAAYAPLRADMRAYRAEWTVPPPAPWNYLPELARRYFGTGWLGIPALALAGLGLWSALRERTRTARLGLGVLVPLCVASLLGVSTVQGAYARFLSPVLPILLLLVVLGSDALGARWRAARSACVVLVVACWSPQFARQLEERDEHRYSELSAFLAHSEPAEVLPIGYGIERYLSAELLRDPRGALATWLGRGTSQAAAGLFVVCSERPLQTQARAQTLGGLQVIQYEERDPLERLRHLRADLLATLKGYPIEAELLDHYGALMTLAQTLGERDELQRFTVYYYECFLRTERLREVPDNVLAVRTTMSNQKLVKALMRDTTPAAQAAR